MEKNFICRLCALVVLCTAVLGQDAPDLTGEELVVRFSLYLMEPGTTAAMVPTTTMKPTTTTPPPPPTTTGTPMPPYTGPSTTSPTPPSQTTTMSPNTTMTESEMMNTTEVGMMSTMVDMETTMPGNETEEEEENTTLSTATSPTTTSTTSPTTSTATTGTSTSTPVATTTTDGTPFLNDVDSGSNVVKRSINDAEMAAIMATNTTDYPPGVITDVIKWLDTQYKHHIGYKNVSYVSDPSALDNHAPIVYDVKYDLKKLSDAGLLDENGLIETLDNTKDNITDSDVTFGGGDLVIDGSQTGTVMEQEIAEVKNEVLPNICVDLDLTCPSSNTTCETATGGSMTCTANCEVYNREYPECTKPTKNHAVIFLEGTCNLTKEGIPYCNCGKSPGDVMNNFYIEPNCVSAAFVVGMAAGLGGFLILVFMFAVIGLACSRKSKNKHHDHISAYSDSPKFRNKDEMLLDDIERNGRAINNAYDNRAYEPYRDPIDKRIGVSDNEYEHMRASLSHIDPKVDGYNDLLSAHL